MDEIGSPTIGQLQDDADVLPHEKAPSADPGEAESPATEIEKKAEEVVGDDKTHSKPVVPWRPFAFPALEETDDPAASTVTVEKTEETVDASVEEATQSIVLLTPRPSIVDTQASPSVTDVMEKILDAIESAEGVNPSSIVVPTLPSIIDPQNAPSIPDTAETPCKKDESGEAVGPSTVATLPTPRPSTILPKLSSAIPDVVDSTGSVDSSMDAMPVLTPQPSHSTPYLPSSIPPSLPRSLPSPLPPPLSLMSALKVPDGITASSLYPMCLNRRHAPSSFTSIYDESAAPPPPPTPSPVDEGDLNPPAPIFTVNPAQDMKEVEEFILSHPICIIRGLCDERGLDLSMFTTESLLKVCPGHKVEIRMQRKQDVDINEDKDGNQTWMCESEKGMTNTSFTKHAAYQNKCYEEEQTAKHLLEEEEGEGGGPMKRRKMEAVMIQFGTNVDLSDRKMFGRHLEELNKLPSFIGVEQKEEDMLAHLGYDVYGMNTVQLYMKVEGARTPAHVENNCITSVNVNIGPGPCVWFGVDYKYWKLIDEELKKQNIDFLSGSWWPIHEELTKLGVPVYRLVQGVGDLIVVGPGCIHWVQSTETTNNLAWNCGPMTKLQLDYALTQYEVNKLTKYKSLVPMQQLSWNLAKWNECKDPEFVSSIRSLLILSLSYARMVADWATSKGKKIKGLPEQKINAARYCTDCMVEVWNVLLVKGTKVYCVHCAVADNLKKYTVHQQWSWPEMAVIFDGFGVGQKKKMVSQ